MRRTRLPSILPALLLLVAAAGPAGAAGAEDQADPPASQPASPPAAEQAAPAAQPGFGVTVGPVDIGMRGYLRAPLRLGIRSRDNEPGHNIHTPWLVDDDYFRSGFAYTRIQESDWAELYFTVSNKYLVGEVALMGSLFSDWARPLLDRQLGIAQAAVTFRWQSEGPRLRFRLNVKAGAFWDRFGWLENYDTYMFGRTHQMGGQVRLEFAGERLAFTLLHGVGAHLEMLDANQGLTLLNYLHAGVRYRDLLEGGFYFLSADARDQRKLAQYKDADMRVIGLDLRLSTPYLGQTYLAGSIITASQGTFLTPVIEVLHSYGGRGLAENYFGIEKSENGSGSLYNLALEETFSLRALLSRVRPGRRGFLRGGDITWKLFGLMSYTLSPQVDLDPAVNRDGRLLFKWGTEGAWQALPWMMVSLRFDRVILDVQDEQSSFRVLTPRVTFTANWLLGAQVYLQYSRYFYGERVRLRTGQVPLESLPDTDVFKLQAQISF
jgi:hypothetical protein